MRFESFQAIRAAMTDLPQPDLEARRVAVARWLDLTKPAGSLGRLEEVVDWLAAWQRRGRPGLDHVHILVFAGNHGVAARGVSAYPAVVTAQMVDNFERGGAAINQLARLAGARLSVMPLWLDEATADFTSEPAMTEERFAAAFRAGADAVPPIADLVVLGELGIGNTTSAAAICHALFDGAAGDWVGRGTGVDDAGLERKRVAVEAGLGRHSDRRGDAVGLAAALGGHELAGIAGACLAARLRSIPVLLDGFVATAAVAPLAAISRDALAHCLAGHVSSERGHRDLLRLLDMDPLVDLDMRLGEATGAAVALHVLRAGLACHAGMATFADAAVARAE